MRVRRTRLTKNGIKKSAMLRSCGRLPLNRSASSSMIGRQSSAKLRHQVVGVPTLLTMLARKRSESASACVVKMK